MMIDSTVVRAHPCATGAQNSAGQVTQAPGRSRGGLSTKVHLVVDTAGNPMRLSLRVDMSMTARKRHPCWQTWILNLAIADRGYAAQALVDHIVTKRRRSGDSAL